MAQSTHICAPAAVRLTLRFPFWTEVYYSMATIEASPELVAAGITTQATDGRTIWINKAFFTSIPLEQQVAELVHELCHKIFLHCTRRGHRDHKIWNIACDYAINAMMKNNGFTIPPDWLLDMKYDGWLAERIYADLIKQAKENPGKPQPQLAPGRDDIKEPANMSPEEVERYEVEVKSLVDRALATAKAMGKVPVGMEQGLTHAHKAAREPWYNHLHRYMQSLTTSEYNWARINRRTLRSHGCFTPLHQSEALGDIALFIDTSGSCYQASQQQNFAAHLNAILAEAKPHRVHLYYFDARVYPGEVIEAGELDIATKPKGGGGTSFVPIFDALEEDNLVPEVCIILTDLMGHFPSQAPEYPVVWASIYDQLTAPFGETIYVCD